MEKRIKEKLLSPGLEDQNEGLVLLDREYRDPISAYVRAWANNARIQISSEDLADIWQETVVSVARAVVSGKFKFAGSLGAYLRVIANRRGVDMLRGRIRIEESNIAALEEACCRSCQVHVFEEIKACYASLSENLQVVLSTDVKLFLRNFRWVSLCELTEEINRGNRRPLSESAVKSRRDRARQQLRIKLREREQRD